MAAFTLGPDPIARGWVVWPYRGVPTAQLLLGVPWGEERVRPGEPVDLTLRGEGTPLTLHGTAVEVARTPAGWAEVRWVGGAGRLARRVKPRAYRNVPLSLIARDAVSEVGERPGWMEAEATAPVWTRMEEPAHAVLDRVAERSGAIWRVNERGEVELVRPRWEAGPEVPAVERMGYGAYTTPLDLSVRPWHEVRLGLGGRTVPLRVGRLVYWLGPDLQMEVWRA